MLHFRFGNACSSRCGAAPGSTACRSRWPRPSACRGAAPFTTPPAPCATWSRTTCSVAVPPGDGAAAAHRQRVDPRREDQGAAARDAHARAAGPACAASSTATSPSRAWRRDRPPRPSPRCGCGSTTGAGRRALPHPCRQEPAADLHRGPGAAGSPRRRCTRTAARRRTTCASDQPGRDVGARRECAVADRRDAGAADRDGGQDRPGAGEADAYERVLGDALHGDQTLFAREDCVEEAWRIIDPALVAPPPVQPYAPGTWGRQAAVAPALGWHDPKA